MNRHFRSLFSLALIGAATAAFAAEMLEDNGFEASEGGAGPWVEYSSGGFQVIGNWEAYTGDGTGNSAWLGGYAGGLDQVYQFYNNPGVTAATLTFDLTWYTASFTGSDFLTVFLFDLETSSAAVIDQIDLGDDTTSDFFFNTFSYDLEGPIGDYDAVVFQVDTAADGFGSSAFIDNVSFNATEVVPEPASMAALGLGALALLRRRRKA